MRKIKLANVLIDNITMEEAVKKISELVLSNEYNYIVTPNVDHIIKLEKDSQFRKVYENASLVLTDGVPLIWLSKIKNKPIIEKISGSDLFPRVCDMASKKGYSIFLLGAAEGVAADAAKKLEIEYEGIRVVGTYSPPFNFENNDEEIDKIVEIVNNVKPDILFVGLGAPKQEKFIYKYRNELKVPVSLAVGAAIDFQAGSVKRAPKWMQKVGLEWFFRFIQEPRRMFKRYFIDDIKFLKYIFREE